MDIAFCFFMINFSLIKIIGILNTQDQQKDAIEDCTKGLILLIPKIIN